MKRILTHWRLLGTGSSPWASMARIFVYGMLLFFAFECVTIDFRWPEQAVLGILTIALAFAIHRTSGSELVTLALMFASMLATARYAYWRVFTVGQALGTSGSKLGVINIVFMLILITPSFEPDVPSA